MDGYANETMQPRRGRNIRPSFGRDPSTAIPGVDEADPQPEIGGEPLAGGPEVDQLTEGRNGSRGGHHHLHAGTGTENERVMPIASSVLQDGDPPGDSKAARHRDQGERLRRARIDGGFRTASDFARQVGVSVSTYICHENGSRPMTPEQAELYERALRLQFGYLLYGSALSRTREVPIVGVIREPTGRIEAMPDGALRYQPVFVDVSRLAAHFIEGNALYPAYRHGDNALHEPFDRAHFDPASIDGRECIVELDNGDHLLRMVVQQANGLWTLLAYSGPPMMNQRIVAGAPVRMVLRSDTRWAG